MNQTSLITYLLPIAFLTSCIGQSELDDYEAGQCFKETRTNYASYAKQNERIYRIEEIVDRSFKVSLWYGRSWLYQGKKKSNYFSNRSSLVYEETNCPGTRKNAAITDKIKSINVK
ncbi:hypothetical protein [Halobacteriovorax sp.]|uniref:hypothetical protein n=1 Tax=Halobacteriovorax sp. TaxID=2020862 RepID=UPI00356AD143